MNAKQCWITFLKKSSEFIISSVVMFLIRNLTVDLFSQVLEERSLFWPTMYQTKAANEYGRSLFICMWNVFVFLLMVFLYGLPTFWQLGSCFLHWFTYFQKSETCWNLVGLQKQCTWIVFFESYWIAGKITMAIQKTFQKFYQFHVNFNNLSLLKLFRKDWSTSFQEFCPADKAQKRLFVFFSRKSFFP